MASGEQRAASHQRDTAVHPFNGIVVELVVGCGKNITDICHFVLHVRDGLVDIRVRNEIAASGYF
jgi:hypothetical protein